MKTISSLDNPLYKQLKKLAESSRERRKAGKTLLDGMHLIQACIQAGVRPEVLVVSASALQHGEITQFLAGACDMAVVTVTDAMFSALSPVETPTGILALIDIPASAACSGVDFCLMVEDVQDPGNLGSMLRSAAASGVRRVYLSAGCVDAWSPKVLRGGMGAHFVLAIEERVSLLEKVQAFDGLSLATSLDATGLLFDTDLTGNVAVLVGNEGAGLSHALCAAASVQVRIPMVSRMESLNVAAATAICLFERVRQCSVSGLGSRR